MASKFARDLKNRLESLLEGRVVRLVNSPRTEFDRDTEVVICHGKKLTRELRIHNRGVNKEMVAKQILNDSCVFVFAKNLAEVMDYEKVDLGSYAPKLARWISVYGFSSTSTCTVCLEEGVENPRMVVCPECQAGVCPECFARCVRSKMVPGESLPNIYRCPTCSTEGHAFDAIHKSVGLTLAETRADADESFWDVLDKAVRDSHFTDPQIFVYHPTLPFDYLANLTIENGEVLIGTQEPARVSAMVRTEGTLLCVGDIPQMCPCGAESCDKSGKTIGVTNGRAFVFRSGKFSEIRDGFPLVLSCYYSG